MGDEAPGDQPKINPTTGRPWTQEERDEQSRRAKELVSQGKFGGQNHGRRRQIPAYAAIAAEAQKKGKQFAEVLIKIALNDGPNGPGSGLTPPKLQMDAIKQLTELELKAQSNRREEEDHLLKLPRDELERELLKLLSGITGEDYDIDLDPGEVTEGGDDYTSGEQDEAEEDFISAPTEGS